MNPTLTLLQRRRGTLSEVDAIRQRLSEISVDFPELSDLMVYASTGEPAEKPLEAATLYQQCIHRSNRLYHMYNMYIRSKPDKVLSVGTVGKWLKYVQSGGDIPDWFDDGDF